MPHSGCLALHGVNPNEKKKKKAKIKEKIRKECYRQVRADLQTKKIEKKQTRSNEHASKTSNYL